MLVRADRRILPDNGYPTSDGKPMAETDQHRTLMSDLIAALDDHFAADPTAYVSGNLLVFYEEGNKRRHVAPDVFVVFGVEKALRPNYRVWAEGKGPAVVIELTSATTRKEDRTKKWTLYRDLLKVPEYFLFDPFGDYLDPRLQGYRLYAGEYREVRPVDGRLPSRKLGLLFEAAGDDLRLVDAATGVRLPTRKERVAEVERLRRENEELRRRLAGQDPV